MLNQLDAIKELIANNQTNEALLLLLRFSKINLEVENTVLTTLAEYNDLLLQINRGTLDTTEVEKRKSQIRIRTLETADLLFRLNKQKSFTIEGNQLVIKDKRLDSIRVLVIMSIISFLIAFTPIVILGESLDEEYFIFVVIMTIAGVICVGSFASLLIVLIVNHIKK